MVEISMTPNVWINWARIAVRQERRAAEARTSGLPVDGAHGYLGLESDEVMLCVTAVRSVVETLLVKELGPTLGVTSPKHLELRVFTLDLSYGDCRWQDQTRLLRSDRNHVIHYEPTAGAAQPHPVYPSHVSALSATYTRERAAEVLDFMFEGVLIPLWTAPAPAVVDWVADRHHVFQLLADQRAGGSDLW